MAATIPALYDMVVGGAGACTYSDHLVGCEVMEKFIGRDGGGREMTDVRV